MEEGLAARATRESVRSCLSPDGIDNRRVLSQREAVIEVAEVQIRPKDGLTRDRVLVDREAASSGDDDSARVVNCHRLLVRCTTTTRLHLVNFADAGSIGELP